MARRRPIDLRPTSDRRDRRRSQHLGSDRARVCRDQPRSLCFRGFRCDLDPGRAADHPDRRPDGVSACHAGPAGFDQPLLGGCLRLLSDRAGQCHDQPRRRRPHRARHQPYGDGRLRRAGDLFELRERARDLEDDRRCRQLDTDSGAAPVLQLPERDPTNQSGVVRQCGRGRPRQLSQRGVRRDHHYRDQRWRRQLQRHRAGLFRWRYPSRLPRPAVHGCRHLLRRERRRNLAGEGDARRHVGQRELDKSQRQPGHRPVLPGGSARHEPRPRWQPGQRFARDLSRLAGRGARLAGIPGWGWRLQRHRPDLGVDDHLCQHQRRRDLEGQLRPARRAGSVLAVR